jgi:hypothetical protein
LARNSFINNAEWEGSVSCSKNELPLYSKLWPHPGNELQKLSDNFNVESTTDTLPCRQTFFTKDALFAKKYARHYFDIGLLQTKLFGT